MSASTEGKQPAARPLRFAVHAMQADCLPPVAGEADVGEITFAGAAVDSRAVAAGMLFFATAGERVDGFDFAGAAVKAGAVAVVVQRGRGRPAGCDGVFVLAVDDVVAGLGALAHAVRRQFKGRVVGVTGSNGKTTTKELVAAALQASGKVLRTPGNFNTEIGLPLVILSAHGDEDYWVLEMAMRGRGEIALLVDIALPHVALITNVGAAHVGRLGSLKDVAAAKAEIFSRLDEPGIAGWAVAPADEPLLGPFLAGFARQRVIGFSGAGHAQQSAQVRVLEVVARGAEGALARVAVGDQPLLVRVPLAGAHNVTNAAAALAVVYALGLPAAPAARALTDVRLPAHRSHPVAVGGRVILDDCYNANPASMTAALATATGGTAGRAFALLGDMLELGDDANEIHRALGGEAARMGIAGLAVVGQLGRLIGEGARAAGLAADRVTAHDDPAEAARVLAAQTEPGDWILVKASRGARLERAVDVLLSLWPPASTVSPAEPGSKPGKTQSQKQS